MSSSRPISLPSTSQSSDYAMASGSYTGSANGSFNPASYTRHFLGSPISWRAGSLGFGGRVFPNGSPVDQMLGVEFNKHSSSYESDRDAIINALNMVDREDELCRNYQCCGLQLNDLHALVEHFEEVHILVTDHPSAPGGQQSVIGIPFNPQCVPAKTASTSVPQHAQAQMSVQEPMHSQASEAVQAAHYHIPFDPDEMELEMDVSHSAPPLSVSNGSSPESVSSAPTPPDTPVSTPLSSFPSPTVVSYMLGKAALQSHTSLPQLQVQHLNSPYSNTSPYNSPYTSQPSSPHYPVMSEPAASDTSAIGRQASSSSPLVTGAAPGRPNLNLNLSSFSRPSSAAAAHNQNTGVEPFNAYGRYAAEYSVGMPGAKLDGDSGISGMDAYNSHEASSVKMECVPPALVFSNAGTRATTPSASRVPSPSLRGATLSPTSISATTSTVAGTTAGTATTPSSTSSGSSSPTSRSSTSISRPPTASLLLSKPFKCPKPNCNKSYKQANGLKYHITHGSCNFAPPKDLEQVQALLERKRRDRAAQAAADGDIDDPSIGSEFDDLSSITETELREVEREAEMRLKPFACGIGDCSRRYKNMNGLRYHYQHSGEHGVIGLGLLASGTHECLNQSPCSRDSSIARDGARDGRKPRPSSKPASRAASISRANTPVSALPPPTLVAPAVQYVSANVSSAVQQIPHTFPSHSQHSSSSSLAAAATAQVQAQAQLAYQQRVADNQRAQYAQQQLLQHIQQKQSISMDGQPSPLPQHLQAQFAVMQSRMYGTTIAATAAVAGDVTMAG